MTPSTIADVLAQTGDDLEAAIAALSRLADASAPAALAAIADYTGLLPCSASLLQGLTADFDILSFAECQQRKCLFLRGAPERELYLVTCHMLLGGDSQYLECAIASVDPTRIVRILAQPQALETLLWEHSRQLRAMDTVEAVDTGPQAELPAELIELSLAGIENATSPVVRLVDSTLYDALQLGASDIHFEVQNRQMHIKYRMDGVLQSIRQIDSIDIANQVISRIKVLAELDISERRIPQDGRFRVVCDQREVDFRVSIMPNITAEDAVLRVLDRKHLMGQFQRLTLDTLSFDAAVKQFIRHATTLPYGLVTGPTGSGKTTTLYAAISEINTGLDKIVTIEDPIEYQLAGILQIPVNEKKGLTFARGLRSVLRHDPDKIMVGEIRDAETAHIAVQAALTGHQVFTTVHANNAFDVIGRFSNMNVDTFSLVAALSGIVAQRLLRLLCPQCAVLVRVAPDSLSGLGPPHGPGPATMEVHAIREARGCPHCRGTGYKGRAAIAETLPVDDDMKNLLLAKASVAALRQQAISKGFRSLRQSALALVLSGQTSIAEINRVTPDF